jgi:hypothetical protein
MKKLFGNEIDVVVVVAADCRDYIINWITSAFVFHFNVWVDVL